MQNAPHAPHRRPLTVTGLALVLAAIRLSMLPWLAGVGFVWSMLMLGGTARGGAPMLVPNRWATTPWRSRLDHPLLLVLDQARGLLIEHGYRRFFYWGGGALAGRAADALALAGAGACRISDHVVLAAHQP